MSGDGSTLFSGLRADGYGALLLKWFCLLRHVCGVVWTISQSVEERGKQVCLGGETDGESNPQRERV